MEKQSGRKEERGEKTQEKMKIARGVNEPILIIQNKDDINITARSETNIAPEELSVWNAIPL